MKRSNILILLSTLLICALLLTSMATDIFSNSTQAEPDVFFGIDIGYGTYEDTMKNIYAVSDYVNLIILGSLDVTMATENLTKVCDYLYEKGIYFIIYVGFAEDEYLPPRGPDLQFFNRTADRWGDKFLGAYFFDEVGGKQIDGSHPVVTAARSHTEAAEIFFTIVKGDLDINFVWYEPPTPNLFVSDYALFWYDYLVGYDVVFTEFVGNQSRQLAVALGRGAAKTFDKDWGAIITWKYDQAPYMADATELYSDMILAYQNGAKYIVVFNSPDNQTATTEYGTLTSEHFEAMKQFWDYTKNNPRKEPYSANTAYVLPKDYGYGFRGPDDKIWGLWEADELSPVVWNDANHLIAQYGKNLDIVYETLIYEKPVNLPYDKLIYWNGTTIEK